MFLNPQEKIERRVSQLVNYYALTAEKRLGQIGRINSLINVVRETGKLPTDIEERFLELGVPLSVGYHGEGVSDMQQPGDLKLEALSPWLRREYHELRARTRVARRHAKALRRLLKEE